MSNWGKLRTTQTKLIKKSNDLSLRAPKTLTLMMKATISLRTICLFSLLEL